MAGFLYFIEIGSAMAPAVMERLGGNHTHKQDVVGQTPGEKAGAVFGQASYRDEKQLHRIKYLPAQQTWQKIPGLECWVGYYSDDPPKAKDLKKPKQMGGHDVELQGDKWHIPYTMKGQDLPRKMVLDENGEWIFGGVIDEYESMFEAAVKYWDFLGAGEEAVTTYSELSDMATTMLMCNYFVSPIEVSILELLNTETVNEVLMAIVDLPQLNRIHEAREAKKKGDLLPNSQASGSSNMNDGSEAMTQPLTPV